MENLGCSLGEWLVDGNTVFCLNNEKHPVNRFSATVYAGFDDFGKRAESSELVANALLMGASKDLYLALRDLLERVQSDADCKNWFLEEQGRALEALSKAEGE